MVYDTDRAWNHARELRSQAISLLEQACERYKPEAVFLFFSGGYDSLVTAHLSYQTVLNCTAGMMQRRSIPDQPDIKVAHINTGIGVPETRQYAHYTSLTQSWPYAEYTTPVKYEDIVKAYGFPGPGSHRYMYIKLKERAIDALVRDHIVQRSTWHSFLTHVLEQSYTMPFAYQQHLYTAFLKLYPLFREAAKSKVLFVTGVRLQESARRMGHVQAFQEEGRRIWVAPLLDWTKEDILNYLEFWQLPRNPVVDTLHMSGECLCGSFSHEGELEEITFWYPDTGEHIKELERIVYNEGFVWGWEEAPPSWWNQMKKGQEVLPGFQSLCSSCEARHR